jgi:hypothetical protein
LSVFCAFVHFTSLLFALSNVMICITSRTGHRAWWAVTVPAVNACAGSAIKDGLLLDLHARQIAHSIDKIISCQPCKQNIGRSPSCLP